MLTIRDLDEIEKLIDVKLDEKLKFIPTKEEFFGWMDKIMGELKAMREEHKMLSQRVYGDLEPRLQKVEEKLNIQHAV